MNKKIKRIVGLMLVMFLGISQLMTSVTNVQAAIKSPKMNRTSLTLTVGRSKKLIVRNGRNVKWSSSNRAVAAVSKNGTVKAKKAGKAMISAKVSGRTLKCKVTVKKKAGSTNKKIQEVSS